MPHTHCTRCGGIVRWRWEDAFDKFGFDDGDGQVMTDAVVQALQSSGYTVCAEPWEFHNIVITSIKQDQIEQIPETARIGYDEARNYLPPEIVQMLDRNLGHDVEVEA